MILITSVTNYNNCIKKARDHDSKLNVQDVTVGLYSGGEIKLYLFFLV